MGIGRIVVLFTPASFFGCVAPSDFGLHRAYSNHCRVYRRKGYVISNHLKVGILWSHIPYMIRSLNPKPVTSQDSAIYPKAFF